MLWAAQFTGPRLAGLLWALARAGGRESLAEEMSDAYKDVRNVVDVVEQAGLSRVVARLRPLGVVKG